jgi:GntR family transcriptional regulator
MVETAHTHPLHHEKLSRPHLAGPLYFQIQQLLRVRILSKEWADGRALPNETELARSYAVSVGTMRKALDLLAQSKVIVRRQGLGTFVNHRHDDPPSRFRRWIAEERLVAEQHTHVIDKTFGHVPRDDARLLRIADHVPVARINVQTEVAGRLAAIDYYVIPVTEASDLDDFMTDTGASFSEYLERLEARITRAEDRFKLDIAGADLAANLGMGEGSPVLRLNRIAFTREERPLFLCRRIMVPSAADYQVVIE